MTVLTPGNEHATLQVPTFLDEWLNNRQSPLPLCINIRFFTHRYTGQDICFGYNEDSLTIFDMTDPASPVELSRTTYERYAYTHQVKQRL